ncbi:MAG: DUF1501 domain-containing protein [Myxococcota bacterium]|nr:DUF1501 domain-containing protein [Myxococcota bacterium]
MNWTRREFAGLVAAGFLAPSALMAAPTVASKRKFLFVFAAGGWDPTWVFAPMFGRSGIDVDTDSTTSTQSGIEFVDSQERPSVRAFFQRYGSRTCVLNGMEVRSITHDTCRRLVLTGSTQAQGDDWPAILAGESSGFTLPCLVLSGPSYTAKHPTVVVRAGETGQLSKLLSGEALQESDSILSGFDPRMTDLVAAHVNSRAGAFAGLRTGVGEAGFVRDLSNAHEQLALVRDLPDLDLGSVDTSGYVPVSQRVSPAITCFRQGITRCATVKHEGLWGTGWDTHAAIQLQGDHYETLFADLLLIQDMLENTPGEVEASLADEVVMVVFSEMGRTPKVNAQGGKDHWTDTSAMILGPGVSGGRVIGAYDDVLLGQKVDLASGELSESGTRLTSAHLGATILALGDVDPGDYLGSVPPIGAVLG